MSWLRAGVAACAATLILLLGSLLHGAAQPANGTVAGRVTLAVAKSAPLATSVYGRRGVAPKRSVNAPEIRNVIVYVQGLRPGSPPPPSKARIAQRDEQFVPPVTAVTVGSSVEFPNEDPFFHNVFSLSKAANFDLGRYPSGGSRTRQFAKSGIVKVFCHLHAQMTALIMVLDHPWFTIPAEDGTFVLPAMPAGEVTVVAWHERIGERRARVRVTPGDTTKVTFTLPVLESTP